MVAKLALRVGRIYHRRLLRLHDWAYWSDVSKLHGSETVLKYLTYPGSLIQVSYIIPSRQQKQFWNLGLALACPKQSGNGMHLVWRPRLDRRDLRILNDPEHLAFLG